MNFSWIVPIGENETAKQIERCLKALGSIVHANDEIILIANESNKIIAKNEISKFECIISYVDHPNRKTPGAARNEGLKFARYDRVIFQDIDDVPTMNRRKICTQALINPGTILACGYQVMLDDRSIGFRTPSGGINQFFFRTNIFLPASAVYFRTEKQYFDDDLLVGEDTLFFMQLLLLRYKVTYSDKYAVHYYIQNAKIKSRHGFVAMLNEWKFRKRLIVTAPNVKNKFIAFLGCLIIITLKLLPFSIFKRIYRKAHAQQ